MIMDSRFIFSENDLTIVEYKELRENAGWKALSDPQIQKSISKCYTVAVRQNGEIVGMARCISDDTYMAYVFDVVVKERFRGQGIGKRMVNMIIGHYKELTTDMMQIVLLAVKKDVESFYTQIGFKKYPNLINGSGMGMWINGKPY